MKKFFVRMLSLLLCGVMLLSMVPMTIFAEEGGENSMYITDLKVNNLVEPIGIDTVPTFRWINHMDGYACSQSAYRIIVASTAKKAAAHDGDVWDSGKVQSNLNYDIAYGGNALTSRTEYFFTVQVWDEKGDSVWSDVSKFETGILDDTEWTAKWIGGKTNETRPVDIDLSGANWIWLRNGAAFSASADGAVYFRSTFTVDARKTVDNVILGMTTDNYSTAYINGAEAAKMATSGEVWRTGAVADITSLVNAGENCIAVYARNVDKGYAGHISKIVVTYTDGSKNTFVTDSTWKASVTVNSGWQNSEYDDSAWTTPDQAVAYGGSPWVDKVTLPSEIILKEYSAAPMLRKTFDVSKDIAKARIYIVGLGLYELYVNGEYPDDTVLNPSHTQYDDTVHYRTYDVTDMLTSGKNAIAVELGDGFYHLNLGSWSWNSAPWYDDTKLLFELDIEYTDGTKETIISDESWKTYSDGPVTVNNMYLGETYDATKEVNGWTAASFDDSTWDAVSLMNAPTGDIVFENMEPMRRLATYTPTVENAGEGKWLISNPLMVTGWAKINIDAPAGTEIKIAYGEKLDSNGEFIYPAFSGNELQRDVYIAGGYEGETYEPKYSYKDYKYILVENHAAEITSEDVECYMIANDIELISNFETGNKTVNDLHGIALRTLLNNFQGKPTDTPVYEKNGWTGDYNVALDMIHYNYDVSNFNAKFMQDIEDAQTAEGMVPLIAPISATWGGGHKHNPSWNMAYIGGVYDSWQYSGNFSLVEEHYDSMRACALAYITVLKGNGYVWLDNLYGDWEVPDHVSAYSPEGSGIICTAYAYHGLECMAIFADEMGKTKDAAEYREAMAKVYTAFNEKYYDAEKGYYDTGWWNANTPSSTNKYRQTSNLIPLAFGLCPDEYKESVAASIVKDIVDTRSLHLNTGCIGTKHVLTELSNAGYGDIAYELLMQDTYPSWGYWLANGSDSAWEAWPISARSYNHYFLATYDDWFFTHLAGIRDVKNGYETVTLKPEIYTGLGYVDCSIDTVRGTLESSWGYNESGALVWTVRVPVGTTATVYLPFDCASVNGKALAKQEGITVNADNLTVLSGEYSFTLDTSVLEKEALGETIAMCETYNANNYPAEKFASFTEVFDAAKAVYNTENATAEELYNANTELLDAMEVLAEHAFGNIARGKAVSVSSDVSGYGWSKEKLTDGDRINKNSSTGQQLGWSSNQSTATDHAEWVTVDLGAYYKFDKVCIMPSGNKTEDQLCEGFPKNFTISVSMDGESWTTLVNETNYTAPYAVIQEFEVTASYARYVRLYASSLNPLSNDGGRYRMQLAEIEVYNSTTDATDGVVYVADGGTGDGSTDITPIGTLADAFAALNGKGGVVVLVGD
ncbi:MAG: family 78 glycoside hydrolase catalytic domain, partial [Clostridia bacterium]|nr:family 78 glycoside hydrolase catalytic domain [Clostridia bacterium]